jgi:HAMP domain-containing protein
MVRPCHVPVRTCRRILPAIKALREVDMPQTLIVIFLLFFAMLAFAWFYWQRAKSRTVTTTESVERADPTETPPAT